MKDGTLALQPEEGEALWQPLPSTGFVINKITPDNSPYDNFSTGIQVLEPGAHIRRHAHARAHEFLFCYAGTGYAELDGTRHEVVPETLIMIGRGVQHLVQNTSDVQMRLLWFISPAGLEEWFRAIGRPKRDGEPQPPPFDRPPDIKAIQDRMHFVRPDNSDQ
jgi:quercetin dioxygenase-like cupin family protein